jgi:hypothetical protein
MMEGSSPLMDETAPKDILDGILKVQQQQMKRPACCRAAAASGTPSAMAATTATRTLSYAHAPVLRPNEPVPARPVL